MCLGVRDWRHGSITIDIMDVEIATEAVLPKFGSVHFSAKSANREPDRSSVLPSNPNLGLDLHEHIQEVRFHVQDGFEA
jgi:hypothetical protein